MRPVPEVIDQQFGAFTARQAVAAGWSDHALRHAVAGGQLVRLRRGAFGLGGELTDADRQLRDAAAVALVTEYSAISHLTAARSQGLPTWMSATGCVTSLSYYSGDLAAIHLHRNRMPPGHVHRSGALHITAPARTVLDVAREHGITAGVVIGDAALRTGLTSRVELDRIAEDCRRWPGIRRARRAVQLLDPRAESPLESRSRLVLMSLGLPRPQLQTTIRSLSGAFLGRVDFYWDELGVIGEADGMIKYEGRADDPFVRDALGLEKIRQEGLEDTGLIVVRWRSDHLRNPAVLEQRLAAAFTRAARRPADERRWFAVPTSPTESPLWTPNWRD